MQLNAGCELRFDAHGPTPLVLMLRPRSGAGQWIIREEYQITPAINVTEFTDMYGNLCQRLVAMEGPFSIQFSATVQTADGIDVAPGAPYTPVEDLPDDVLHYTLPSRYCQSDQLGGLATEITNGAEPGYDQAEAIRKWIHENVTYQYGTSDASTSAVDTAKDRTGVCRDFTHLGISLCRALNIPARMVVGYLYQLDPMDLHAWFEAYVDGRWFTFDATQKQPRGNRITVAYGRDAADVAFTTQFGPMTLTEMKVWVDAATVAGDLTTEPEVSKAEKSRTMSQRFRLRSGLTTKQTTHDEKTTAFLRFTGITDGLSAGGDVQPNSSSLVEEVAGTYRTNLYLDPSCAAMYSGQMPYVELKAAPDSTLTLVHHGLSSGKIANQIEQVTLSRRADVVEIRAADTSIGTLQTDRIFTDNGMEKQGKLLRLTVPNDRLHSVYFAGVKQ